MRSCTGCSAQQSDPMENRRGEISVNDHQQPTQSTVVHVPMATIHRTIIMGWKSLAHEKGASDFVIFIHHAFSFTFPEYISCMCTCVQRQKKRGKSLTQVKAILLENTLWQ